MPKIIWPEQPLRIREACDRHGVPLPADVAPLLALRTPPPMTAPVAKAFLRCTYAARDLERAERDLRGGGPQTEAFAARTLARRVAALQRRGAALSSELARSP